MAAPWIDLVDPTAPLRLPRSDVLEHGFVLGPLAELAGERRHPVTGECYADMWSAFDDAGQVLSRVDWPPAAP